MATRDTIFAPNEFYHVYNRGTEKRLIYQDASDYRRFQQLLYLANNVNSIAIKDIKKQYSDIYTCVRGDELVAIGAYCLMPNHFHILLTPLVDDGIFKFMNRLATGYSMYFNKKYNRTGRLFEGSYKAKHADSDEYLKYLFSYIHLNPVKLIQSDWKEKGVKNADEAFSYVSEFDYSSYSDYESRSRPESAILNQNSFPEYFKNPSLKRAELLDWLTYPTRG